MTPLTKLDWALAHAQKGWPVFVLAEGTKVPPKGTHGRLDATTDESAIRQWFNEGVVYGIGKWKDDKGDVCDVDLVGRRNANIGIDTDAAGLVVIDIDVPKMPLQRRDHNRVRQYKREQLYGMEAWCDLVDRSGCTAEPPTYEVWTPSGGEHLYFQAPQNVVVSQGTSRLAPGIDVRAANSSIVGAGSATAKGSYALPSTRTVGVLPGWLLMALSRCGLGKSPARNFHAPLKTTRTEAARTKGSPYAQKVFETELHNVSVAISGTRNQALNWAAYRTGQFIGAGLLGEGSVRDALVGAGVEAGLPFSESSKTVDSGLSAGVSAPADVS